MESYSLFIGFRKLGVFTSVKEAKQYSTDDGVYSLIGSNGYRSYWNILNGVLYK